MIKNVVALFFLYSLLACNQTEKKVTDLPVAKNDTFDSYNEEYDIPIPEGFSVDTVDESDKKIDYSKTFICPRLNGMEFKRLNKILENEIRKKADLAYTDTTGKPVDPSDEVSGEEEEIIPLKMYKNEKLVSYGFLDTFSDSGAMRPFRRYFTVNYDVKRSKFILFDDYFNISSPQDSTFFKQLIFGIIGTPYTYFPSLTNKINFSIDEEKVYFYYDMFGELGNPMGLVYGFKKKYLDKFIKNEYK